MCVESSERTGIVAGRSSQENTQGAARVRQATPRRLQSGFGWFSFAFAHRKKLRKGLRWPRVSWPCLGKTSSSFDAKGV